MADATGRRSTLTCPSLAPPWHLIAGVLRWHALSLRDRLSALRLAPVLRDVGGAAPRRSRARAAA